jgi:hypothetical protein
MKFSPLGFIFLQAKCLASIKQEMIIAPTQRAISLEQLTIKVVQRFCQIPT